MSLFENVDFCGNGFSIDSNQLLSQSNDNRNGILKDTYCIIAKNRLTPDESPTGDLQDYLLKKCNNGWKQNAQTQKYADIRSEALEELFEIPSEYAETWAYHNGDRIIIGYEPIELLDDDNTIVFPLTLHVRWYSKKKVPVHYNEAIPGKLVIKKTDSDRIYCIESIVFFRYGEEYVVFKRPENLDMALKIQKKVTHSEEVENLLNLARKSAENEDYRNASRYYSAALTKEPNCWEAYFYSTMDRALGCKMNEIYNMILPVIDVIPSTFDLVDSLEYTTLIVPAIMNIYESILKLSSNVAVASNNYYNSLSVQEKAYFAEYLADCKNASAKMLYYLGYEMEARYINKYDLKDMILMAWKQGYNIQQESLSGMNYNKRGAIVDEMNAIAHKIQQYDPSFNNSLNINNVTPNSNPHSYTNTNINHYNIVGNTTLSVKTTSIVSYLTFIGWLIAYNMGDREGAKTHLNNSLLLIFVGLVCIVLSRFGEPITYLVVIIRIAEFVFWVIGFVYACKGEQKPLPLIGTLKILK